MVCTMDHDEVALVCIQDQTGGSHDHISLLRPVSDLVRELLEEISQRFDYQVDTFDAILQSKANEVFLNQVKEKTLIDAGFKPGQTERNSVILFTLKRVKLKRLTKTSSDENLSKGNESHSTGSGIPPPPPIPLSAPSSNFEASTSYDKWPTVSHHENEVPSSSAVPYVGLVNQAMTCYLNSLLQALFMTPEFRNAIYSWEFDETQEEEEAKSMPYQLQKLFVNLQTSKKASVETTALTRSFGWDSSEAWQQHDIQELCRVMFDALEQKFKGTDQANLISQYEGVMADYVKCLECSTEKHRQDKFLDIPLPVRPFNSSVAYSNVEEALEAFVQAETLDGNNQYHCDNCGKKCDALKGLKFMKFPYLLTLHLKRFDFDYTTLNRIKLNDKVSFPQKLNLNRFISCGAGGTPAGGDCLEEAAKCDDSSTTDSGSALDEDNNAEANHSASSHIPNHHDSPDDDEGIDVGNTHELEKNRLNLAREANESGPYVYELFSIMIHSGSASGGHYYAYIKDFKMGDWYCFNDQSVSRITQEDIQKTFGGGRGYYSGVYSSSTNAYMLMYRQIDPDRNAVAMTADQFPAHLQNVLKRIEEQKVYETRRREREQEMMSATCYYQLPGETATRDFRMAFHKNSSLKEVTKDAYEIASLLVPIEQCRLVTYDRSKQTIECSFDGKEDERIRDLLDQVYKADFFLQIRDKDEQFKVHRPGDLSSRVVVINMESEDVEAITTVKCNSGDTIDQYRNTVAQVIGAQPDSIHLLLHKYRGEILALDKYDALLKEFGFFDNSRVFAIIGPLNDKERIKNIVQYAANILTVHVCLPVVTKEVLEQAGIPSETENVSAWRLDDAGPASDQSASEDSSLTDSERTIVGDPPEPSPGVSPTGSPEHSPHDIYSSSPTSEKQPILPSTIVNRICSSKEEDSLSGTRSWNGNDTLLFRATPCLGDGSTDKLRVLVDKTITLTQLKECLRPHVGVSPDYFKMYRTTNGKVSELVRPSETLKMWGEDEQLTVRLGRALRPGEFAGKVYLLDLNNPETSDFLIEWVIAQGAPVSTVRREIATEVGLKHPNLNAPVERCRLRVKKWKDPHRPLLDSEHLNDISSNWELYLQVLDGPEPVTSIDEMVIFVKKWSPSTHEISPWFELVLDTDLVSDLKAKLSEASGIDQENIQMARARSDFPHLKLAVRYIHSDLVWCNGSTETKINDYPLDLTHGCLLIFRDKTEKIKILSKEEMKELDEQEPKKQVEYRNRRFERGLKICVNRKQQSTEGTDVH